ncbi:MAG TPA: spermidine/putrescine ABC transporter substrate-binding protein [Opitutaceae bacterium]
MRLPVVLLALASSLPALQAREGLNLFAWSEYVPQKVLDGFTAETGIEVNYETFSSNEEMVSKLVAGDGDYDVIQPSDYTAEALIKQGLLAPLDLAALHNLGNIDPAYRHLPYDPEDRYTVPYMSGTVGIVVNTAVVHTRIRSFGDVFQPRFSGRIVVLNDNREIVSWALAYLGLPTNEINAKSLAAARPVITRWLKYVKVFDSDSPKTPLLNGDVDIGVVWSGEAAILWNQDHKFRYILPSESVHRFIDLLAVPVGSRHRAAAHRFIDYVLRPEVSKLISDEFPYTNPNGAARRLLSPAQLANPASYPKGGNLETFRDVGRAASDIDQLMTDIKSAQ